MHQPTCTFVTSLPDFMQKCVGILSGINCIEKSYNRGIVFLYLFLTYIMVYDEINTL